MARVLLAEDDAAMLEMVRRALTGDGHTVVATHDGQEALDVLSTAGAGFDVLLTDIDMPGLNGIALSTKAMALMPKLRVLLMTGFAGGVTIPDALKPHIAGVLTKPLAIDGVRSAVRDAAG